LSLIPSSRRSPVVLLPHLKAHDDAEAAHLQRATSWSPGFPSAAAMIVRSTSWACLA
jgi:hypothetical protein